MVEGTQTHGTIRIHATDKEINTILTEETGAGVSYSRHFNQSEEYFLKLAQPFDVPSFSIHHDVRKPHPDRQYIEALRDFVRTLKGLLPNVFQDLQYTFDPAEVLRPAFYRLLRLNEQTYLYYLRMDLIFRPQRHEVITRGTNDTTPVYRTEQLILDANVIPVKEIQRSGSNDEPDRLIVDELISETWIGETGRGYFVQGIWIDSDLTKFFSKLMLPRGKRVYPYYPFNSKFRTVCLSPLQLEANARRQFVPVLHRSREFLKPHLEQIQQELRKTEFQEDLPLFQEIKATVPRELERFWEPISMKMYLNKEDMKEFQVVIDPDG